jgi:hypothetical protein
MLPTVNLDNQFRFETDEVHNVSTDLHLAGEFVAATLAAAEISPELPLGGSLLTTQASRDGRKSRRP